MSKVVSTSTSEHRADEGATLPAVQVRCECEEEEEEFIRIHRMIIGYCRGPGRPLLD